MRVKTSNMGQAVAGRNVQLAEQSDNIVHFFHVKDVGEEHNRMTFEMAVDRIIAGIETHTAYQVGIPYPVVRNTRYRRFGKR